MARVTNYLVQAFIAKGRGLRAETPVACRSAEAAQRMAEKLAPAKVGVVAFSTAGDAELGEYDDEPTVFFRTGLLPPQFGKRRRWRVNVISQTSKIANDISQLSASTSER